MWGFGLKEHDFSEYALAAWLSGIVSTEDARFESRQGAGLLGLYTLQCCFVTLLALLCSELI
jgi:hypothetical protein